LVHNFIVLILFFFSLIVPKYIFIYVVDKLKYCIRGYVHGKVPSIQSYIIISRRVNNLGLQITNIKITRNLKITLHYPLYSNALKLSINAMTTENDDIILDRHLCNLLFLKYLKKERKKGSKN